jgi:hypothetical protein
MPTGEVGKAASNHARHDMHIVPFQVARCKLIKISRVKF